MRNFMLIFTGLLLMACQWQEPAAAFGTVERDLIHVNAQTSGLITVLNAQKGDSIKTGQILLQQDNTEQLLIVAQNEAQLALAKAQLTLLQQGSRQEQQEQAKANLARAAAMLDDAKLTQTRQVALFTQKLSSAAALQQADAALAVAQASYDVAEQQLKEVMAGSRQPDIEQALQQVKQLEARLQQVQWQLQQLTVIAERDGTVDDILWRRGERVPAGATLLTLSVDDSAYARLYLPANALANWRLGQQVEVWLEGRDAAVNGTIRFISPNAAFTPHFALHQLERSRLVYLTEVSLPQDLGIHTGTPIRVLLP